MKKNKKIKLDEIKIQSYVSDEDAKRIIGGGSFEPVERFCVEMEFASLMDVVEPFHIPWCLTGVAQNIYLDSFFLAWLAATNPEIFMLWLLSKGIEITYQEAEMYYWYLIRQMYQYEFRYGQKPKHIQIIKPSPPKKKIPPPGSDILSNNLPESQPIETDKKNSTKDSKSPVNAVGPSLSMIGVHGGDGGDSSGSGGPGHSGGTDPGGTGHKGGTNSSGGSNQSGGSNTFGGFGSNGNQGSYGGPGYYGGGGTTQKGGGGPEPKGGPFPLYGSIWAGLESLDDPGLCPIALMDQNGNNNDCLPNGNASPAFPNPFFIDFSPEDPDGI